MTYPMSKVEALAGFAIHSQTAKNASQLAMGGETAVDMMLDDLAKALDALYETDEFTALAEG